MRRAPVSEGIIAAREIATAAPPPSMTAPNNTTKSLEEIKAEARRYALSTSKAPKAPYAPTFLAPAAAAAPDEEEEEESKNEEEVEDPPQDDATTNQHTKPPAVSIDDEEYLQFVLGLKYGPEKSLFEDDEDEFQLDPMEDLEDDDDEDDTISTNDPTASSIDSKSPGGAKHPMAHDDDMDWDIHQELGWLQEDDDNMDLTLTNLVNDEPNLTPDHKKPQQSDEDDADIQWIHKLSGLANNPHDRNNPPLPTQLQQEKLRNLLQRHYQLLLQQAIMAVRMAHTDKKKQRSRTGNGTFQRGSKNPPERSVVIENADDLIEIVDSAVGKLIDLRQQRQDSFRTILAPQQDTLLTRAQFRKVKETVEGLHTMTMFDVPGLDELDDTFTSIDQSVKNGTDPETNILWMDKVRWKLLFFPQFSRINCFVTALGRLSQDLHRTQARLQLRFVTRSKRHIGCIFQPNGGLRGRFPCTMQPITRSLSPPATQHFYSGRRQSHYPWCQHVRRKALVVYLGSILAGSLRKHNFSSIRQADHYDF